ncbi:ABC transporter ATP-binding protein [Natronomonas sp. EA1]|uniref:ABC transporter ATP-binding protein n=1 Tax=Natronomonas sp. EA1 TaxID=3421655 RepID=UPI003EBEA7C2
MSGPILSTESVTKTFGGLTAVDAVDMEVEEGEIVGLIGPNGAGKSTLFNCITGALDANEGTVRFDGEEITDWTQDRIARNGLLRMFQHTRVYGDMTVRENMLVAASEDDGLTNVLRPPSDAARTKADELLAYIGLDGLAGVRAGRMSFGQQKLLEFGMGLMADPQMLLMDEPAGGINPSMLNKLIEYIREANTDREVTILLIEHNMEFVMEVADRIYVLAHGEKIAEGTPEEIQNDQRVLDAYLGRE